MAERTNESLPDLLARAGLASRGFVYVVLGLITLSSGLTGLGEEESKSGALSFLRDLPFGALLLFAIGVGLVLFAFWRFSQSVFNADERDGTPKDWIVRAGQLGSGIAYLGLAGFAFQLAVGWVQASDSDAQTESLVALTMRQPFGVWLIGIIGGIFVAVGIGQIWRGVSMAWMKRVDLPDLPVPLLKLIATWGICGRGALFIIIGSLMVYAALRVEPEQAGTLSEALDWLRQLPFGFYLYLIAALGLLSYGLFGIAQAVYRHVDVDGYEDGDFSFDPGLLRKLMPGQGK